MFFSIEYSGNGIEIYVDAEGRDFLVRQLGTLSSPGDYCFLALGAELDSSRYWSDGSQIESAGIRLIDSPKG